MFDEKLTAHLADLSKIAFTESELETMTSQMADIINLMDKVKDFNSNDNTYSLDAAAYKDLRHDEPRVSLETEKIIQNAQNVKNNSFVVPKVV